MQPCQHYLAANTMQMLQLELPIHGSQYHTYSSYVVDTSQTPTNCHSKPWDAA